MSKQNGNVQQEHYCCETGQRAFCACAQMESALSLLRGRAYEAMENRELAAECFREALRADVYCFEAFDCLVTHHMLTAQEGE